VATHNKGVYILAATQGKYPRTTLTMSASICFGAIHSGSRRQRLLHRNLCLAFELAELPLRQDIAVTGSVNRRARSSLSAAVNEKVGRVLRCLQGEGLTGKQGAMIPVKHRGSDVEKGRGSGRPEGTFSPLSCDNDR